jgi:hypothetical protein
MSDDYTPTTERVRYVYACGSFVQTSPTSYGIDGYRGEAEFDRWLDKILDEAREAAWESGWKKGAMSEKSFLGNKMSWERKSNPYRKETQ